MRYLESSSVSLSCPKITVPIRQSKPGCSTVNSLSRLPKSCCIEFARLIHLLLIIQGETPLGGRTKVPDLLVSFVSPVVFCLPLSPRGRVELRVGSFCPASSRIWNSLTSRELRQARPCTRMIADFGARPLDLDCGWSPETEPSSDSSEDIHSSWKAPSKVG